MRYYELIYIVNSNVERKKVDQVMKDIGERLEKAGSKLINHTVWGKKKLAYPIRGNTYGTYILAHYNGGDNEKLRDFDSWLKLSGLTIRHMIVKLDKEPEVVESLSQGEFEDDNRKDKLGKKEDKNFNDEKGENDMSDENDGCLMFFFELLH